MKRFRKAIAMISTLLLLGSGFFVSCAGDDDEDETPKSQPGSGQQAGTGGGQTGGGGQQGGGGDGTETITPKDLESYYKEYFFGGAADSVKVTAESEGNWDAGSENISNDDGSVTITAGTGWGTTPTVSCAAYGSITPGYFARYEYIVLTADLANFTLSEGDGNNGANIKLASPDEMVKLASYGTTNTNGTVTYIVPVSKLTSASQATQIAIIFGGSGTVKFTEFYVTAKEQPAADYSQLNAALTSATEAKNAAVVGTEPGNYSQEAVDTLAAAIKVASDLVDANASTQAEIDAARTTLLAALTTFKGSAVPEGSTYEAPDLTNYYKKYFVTTDATVPNFEKAADTWSSGASISKNSDGTLTLKSASLWGGVSGVVSAFPGLETGILSNYEYIVLTLDMSSFTLVKGEGNNGVNIKIPDIQKPITDNWVKNSDNTRTYYAKISDYADATKAVEFALIVGGTGELVVKEIYVAAAEDPANKAVTGITIDPTTSSVKTGEKVTFTVKDSNLVDRTSDVEYSLSGDAATGSSITNGVLTVGSTAGSITVKATYTVNETPFEAEATITVIGEVTNLITSVSFNTAYLAPGWAAILDNVTSLEAASDYVSISDANAVTYKLPANLAGQWQAQLKINTDADISAGDEWYFSCKLSGVTGGYTIKLNDDEQLIKQQTGIITADGITVSFSGKAGDSVSFTDIPIMFDFGTCTAGDVVISDITIVKIAPSNTGNTENSGESGESGNTETTEPGSIDWSKIDWIGASGDKYKISADGMTVVNVQQPGWASEQGIYMHGEGGISACTLGSGTDGTDFKIDGAGIVVYLSKFTKKETAFTVTNTGGTHNIVVFYADGTEN